MTTVTRNLLFFFGITFAFTWGLCGYLILTMPPDVLANVTPRFIIIAVICGLSPSLAALGISIATRTTSNIFEQFHTRFSKRLLLPALTIVPVIGFLSYLPFRNAILPLPVPVILMGFIWPIFSSLGEELGWRGYAFPRLKIRWGFIPAAVWIGIIWGMWHLPMDYVGLRSHGWYFIPEFLLLGPALLTAHAIIMSYLFCRGNNSVLLVILYHYTITASAIILSSIFPTANPHQAGIGVSVLIQPALVTALAWAVAVLIMIKGDRTIIHSPTKE